MESSTTATSTKSAAYARRVKTLNASALRHAKQRIRARTYLGMGYSAERTAELIGLTVTECRLLKASLQQR